MGVGRKKLRNVVVRMYLRFNKRDYVQYFSIVESMPAFDLLEQNNGIHFDGILGTPFLYQTKAIIDFVDQKIRWDNDREQKKLWGWQWLWKNDPPW